MLILGLESSCDETGIALYDTAQGLLAQTLYSQVEMHEAYGGVVPELASRDHIRRVLPLLRQCLQEASRKLSDIDAIAVTQGPGLAGALLVGNSVAHALGFALNKPVVGVHHLEGHLLSPLLSHTPPTFPFIALLVSGGHTQLMQVNQVGDYHLLGETLDDAAGEAFDKTAKLLGLGYPGGPALAKIAQSGRANQYSLPRPMLHSKDLNFSFSGLKTAVLTLVKQCPDLNPPHLESLSNPENENDVTSTLPAASQARADIARAFEEAMVDVLVGKCEKALRDTGLKQIVVAGGVSANQQLRTRLDRAAQKNGFRAYYPEPALCTDNGAMIAFAAALRIQHAQTNMQNTQDYGFTIKPRWDLSELTPSLRRDMQAKRALSERHLRRTK